MIRITFIARVTTIVISISTIGCGTILFSTGFESYNADGPGILYPLEPPEYPEGDRIEISSDNCVRVINSDLHGSKAVKLYDNSCSAGVYFHGHARRGEFTEGRYEIRFKAYYTGSLYNNFYFSVHSQTNGILSGRAFSAHFTNNHKIFLYSFQREEVLQGVIFEPNTVYAFYILIDLDKDVFQIKVNDTWLTPDSRRFENYTLDNVGGIGFLYSGMNANDSFVLDDVLIKKKPVDGGRL